MLPLYEGKSPGSIAAKRLENQKRLGIVPLPPSWGCTTIQSGRL